jgi:hypothetical protein
VSTLVTFLSQVFFLEEMNLKDIVLKQISAELHQKLLDDSQGAMNGHPNISMARINETIPFSSYYSLLSHIHNAQYSGVVHYRENDQWKKAGLSELASNRKKNGICYALDAHQVQVNCVHFNFSGSNARWTVRFPARMEFAKIDGKIVVHTVYAPDSYKEHFHWASQPDLGGIFFHAVYAP